MAIRNYFYCMLCILSKEKLEINKSINLLQFILSQIFFSLQIFQYQHCLEKRIIIVPFDMTL